MGSEARRAAIEDRFRVNWDAGSGTLRTPVAFENAPVLITRVDQAASIAKPPNSGSWVRLSIREGESNQVDLNSAPRVRETGRIYLQIFVVRGNGTAAARAFADLAKPIFRRAQFSGISCRVPTVQPVGDTEGWWQLNVSWPYYADDIV